VCTPRRPIDVAAATAAAASIRAALTTPSTVAASLASIASDGRRITRIVATIESDNLALTAETRCAVPRTG